MLNASLRVRVARFAAVAAAGFVAVALCASPSASATVAGRTISATEAAQLRLALRAGTIGTKTGVLDICAAAHLACQAEVLTTGPSSKDLLLTPVPLGYDAAELAKAYSLPKSTPGTGTIAVIGVGAYPTLDSDLDTYRYTNHLPTCSIANGCLRQVYMDGGSPLPPGTTARDRAIDSQISIESALDVDMASAACPGCHIISIELPRPDGLYRGVAGTHQAEQDFATAVATARRLGADAVSISYGYPADSYSDSGPMLAAMTQPGMAIVSSSGDSGFYANASSWPANLPTVTSAGGTSLYPTGQAGRGYSETAWAFAGSGCTRASSPPANQPTAVAAYCPKGRAATDVAADADPDTGVAVFDTYVAYNTTSGWTVVGGTSASSPFIAGLYARAGVSASVLGPNTLYADPATDFRDVLIGSNQIPGFCAAARLATQLCVAGKGWDGPTGLGSPKGLAAFTSTN